MKKTIKTLALFTTGLVVGVVVGRVGNGKLKKERDDFENRIIAAQWVIDNYERINFSSNC